MEVSRKAASAKGPENSRATFGSIPLPEVCQHRSSMSLQFALHRAHRSAWHSRRRADPIRDGGPWRGTGARAGDRGAQSRRCSSHPIGEEHWHGAKHDCFMTHLSITEGAPHWGSHVTDAEYKGEVK